MNRGIYIEYNSFMVGEIMETKGMDYEQLFALRDRTQETLQVDPMFKGDQAYMDLMLECDQRIKQTKVELVELS